MCSFDRYIMVRVMQIHGSGVVKENGTCTTKIRAKLVHNTEPMEAARGATEHRGFTADGVAAVECGWLFAAFHL
jgi:hypothetical protein